MIKKLLLILLGVGLACSTLDAQEIKVSEIVVLQNDIQARTKPRQDLNGDNCALLKVTIPIDGITFSGNIVGDVAHEGSMYLVYVPAGTRKITVNHSDYYPAEINFQQSGVTLEKNVTYAVVLQRTFASTDWQYLVFKLTPPNAFVELDDDVLELNGGVAQKLVQVGTSHHYRVTAPGMVTQEGDVVVDDADNKKTVNIALKSKIVDVVVSVPESAEIWINGEKKSSNGVWKGSLNAGTYLMEARMGDRVISSEVHELALASSRQEIVLSVNYGSLSVTSNVLDAAVTLDGREAGTTPLLVRKVLPGVHVVGLSKDGYDPVSQEVEVASSKNTDVKLVLESNAEERARAAAEKKKQEEEAARIAEQKRMKEEAEARAAEEKRQREEALARESEELKRKQEEEAAAKEAELERQREEAAARAAAQKQAAKAAKAASRMNIFVMGNVGYAPAAGDLSYGAMAGFVKQFGGYGKFRSNFASCSPSYNCTSSGILDNGSTIWSNGFSKVSRMTVTGGAMMRVGGSFYPYAGAGFGSRTCCWQDVDGKWAKVTDCSCSGIAVEAGAAFKFGPVMLSVGAGTTAFKYVDMEVGIGITF